MELTADFQQFYGLAIDDMWGGVLPPHRVLTLIQGLYTEVESRFRAAVLRDHPPKPSNEPPGWKGWTPEASALTALTNLKIAEMSKNGKPRKSDLLRTPGEAVKRHAPKTVSDFGRQFKRG